MALIFSVRGILTLGFSWLIFSAHAESASTRQRYEQYSNLPIAEDFFHASLGILAYQETFQSFSNLYAASDSRALLMQESVPMAGLAGKLEFGLSPSQAFFLTGSYAHSETGSYSTPALYGNVNVDNALRNVSQIGLGYQYRFNWETPLTVGMSLNFRSLADDSLLRTSNGYARKNEMRYLEWYLALPVQLDAFVLTPKISYKTLLAGTQFFNGVPNCLNPYLFTSQSALSGEGGGAELALSHVDADDLHFELSLFYRRMAVDQSSSSSCATATGTQTYSEPKNITIESGLLLQVLL